MKYRAVAKKSGDWWIGWLIDLPGVNAQEKTYEELIESLRTGAEDMLSTEIPFEPGAQTTTIEIPTPNGLNDSFNLCGLCALCGESCSVVNSVDRMQT